MLAKVDLREYAMRGAAARAAELTAELNEIYRAFPSLRRGKMAAPAAAEGAPVRRRRRMSAAQRKAVSLRMKKYWAARRKEREKQ